MARYFVAAVLPDEAKDHLIAVQPPAVPGMRLLGRHELHLTLHFLGEVAPRYDELIRKALASLRVNAFPITIRGVGQFPPEGHPQVLWSGVVSSPALLELRHAISTTMADAIGIQPEKRPYSPHVTLARLNVPAPPCVIESYLEENKNFRVSSFLLSQFGLYSSVFRDDVPQYQEVAIFSFDEPPS